MSKQKNSGITAIRDYMVDGHPITRVEALVIFGVPDLTKVVSDLRAEAYTVERGAITFAGAIVRMRGIAVVQPPADLAVREIMLTEYRVVF